MFQKQYKKLQMIQLKSQMLYKSYLKHDFRVENYGNRCFQESHATFLNLNQEINGFMF